MHVRRFILPRLGSPISFGVALTISAAVTVGPVMAQESGPTIEDHETAMKAIDFALDDAEFHIDSRYWADLGADTDALKVQFMLVRAFWAARDAEKAVGFVEQALAANSALSRASMESSKSGASQAVGDLRATCKACHSDYRERTDDGFRIRSGG